MTNTIEDSYFFTFGKFCTVSGWSVKACDSAPPALILSDKVPCGTSSTSGSFLLEIVAQMLLNLAVWGMNKQSYAHGLQRPVLRRRFRPSRPVLLLTITRSLAP
jgi:hypothetical protein